MAVHRLQLLEVRLRKFLQLLLSLRLLLVSLRLPVLVWMGVDVVDTLGCCPFAWVACHLVAALQRSSHATPDDKHVSH